MSHPAALLGPLADWMRVAGATYVRLPDGTEIELAPHLGGGSAIVAESTAQRRERLRAEMREELRTRYAHVGHEPTDDDVDSALLASGQLDDEDG